MAKVAVRKSLCFVYGIFSDQKKKKKKKLEIYVCLLTEHNAFPHLVLLKKKLKKKIDISRIRTRNLNFYPKTHVHISCTKCMGLHYNIKKIIIILNNGRLFPNSGFRMSSPIATCTPNFETIDLWQICVLKTRILMTSRLRHGILAPEGVSRLHP